MCWGAIGFLLIIFTFLLGRSCREVLYQDETGKNILEGKITDKQYKESSYGGYWQITLKSVSVYRQQESEAWSVEEREKRGGLPEEKDVSTEKLEGKYLCQISDAKDEILKIGQRVLLEGNYASWEEPSNPGQFDAGKYYCSQGILGQFKKCKIIQQGSSYSWFWEEMWQIRQKSLKILKQELGEENGAIIGAMLLGEKNGLNEEDKNLYQRNGISHILAISGLHLMLLGSGVVRGLKMILGGNKRVAFSTIFIMSLYCVFTGNSISTIRATIMFALSLVAGMLGRSYDSLSALGLAAILQLFMNPYVLSNSGFLLSFLAVIGVTFLAPKLQEIMRANKQFYKSVCVSLSASVTTLPVLLWNYGTYPWYSVFLNVLILPAMSALLFLAVLLVVLSFLGESLLSEFLIFSVIRNSVVWGIKLILKYYEICCKICEQIFFQDGYIGVPNVLQIVIYSCLIVVAISGIVKHSAWARKMIFVSAISFLSLNLNVGAEVTMLDVGQGDSIVIHNSNGNVYISDCGSSSVSQVGKYRLIPFLKHKGYGRIKGIFISHLDEDHISGIMELLEAAPMEKIEIEYLLLPESVLGIEEDREIVEQLQNLAKQNETKLVYLSQGDKILDGNMEFLCLYPEVENSLQVSQNRNNQSLVLYLKYKDFDMLLTGDIEKKGEMEIAEDIDRISLDVLKVAHHGSSGSSCEEILEKLSPKLSLISCGKNNSYGHPHQETLERLKAIRSEVISTVESGAITLKIGRKIRVYEFKR